MHHLSGIFSHKKLNKKMDQVSSPKPKLVRRNAAKNFDYTPSASTSPSTSGSSAPRTRSLDLGVVVEKTSLRCEGNAGEIEWICQSLGLSGPEDFQIPQAAYQAMKNRSSSDVTPRTKKEQLDGVDLKVPIKQEEVQKFGDRMPHRFGNSAQKNEIIQNDRIGNEFRPCGPAVFPHQADNSVRPVYGGGGGGIKGDRPPLLTPPPAMSLPVLDDQCSTWELLKGFAPDDNKPLRVPYVDQTQSSDDEEDISREGSQGVRIGETIMLSGSCSFTTTNDDDSSSSTTEPVSIISPNGVCKVNITQWMKGSQLGRGSFGTVYEGISCEGFFFAVKEVSLLEQGSQGRQSIYQLEQEIELLSQFEHENIVRYLGTETADSKLYIFLELVTQGSLAKLYQQYRLRDSHVSNYTRQILLGLKYLHDKNVVHRDIKSGNILVASDGTVKLADFGLAKATRLNDLKSCKGTAFWMAPEVVNQKNKGYGLPADIWSLGCTVLEMLTGHVPYYPLEFMQALFKIGNGEAPPIPDTLSKDARDFIQQCLRVNPNNRPTAAELLEHPFLRRQLYAPLGSESPMMRGKSI
ncbi:mitogen-activated protein kinase kinase kinase 1-like [Chenopodium quinoa]|uniref:mitogen-activated protein kinase kinase kinase 1-like n=1 Tax=Chenopodium quinoa TaxID=63459 RepID=UPI000B77F639|nr:mitogen-activated protein kinase kinase kinase 1-like [Chenopodium quinoa]